MTSCDYDDHRDAAPRQRARICSALVGLRAWEGEIPGETKRPNRRPLCFVASGGTPDIWARTVRRIPGVAVSHLVSFWEVRLGRHQHDGRHSLG